MVQALAPPQIAELDELLVANTSTAWRKAAFVVGGAMIAAGESLDDVPDAYFALRVRELVAAGELEARGNLHRIRFSEIRLASAYPSAPES